MVATGLEPAGFPKDSGEAEIDGLWRAMAVAATSAQGQAVLSQVANRVATASPPAALQGLSPTSVAPVLEAASTALPAGAGVPAIPSGSALPAIPGAQSFPNLAAAPTRPAFTGVPAVPNGMSPPGVPGVQSIPAAAIAPPEAGFRGTPLNPSVSVLPTSPAAFDPMSLVTFPGVPSIPSFPGVPTSPSIPALPGLGVPTDLSGSYYFLDQAQQLATVPTSPLLTTGRNSPSFETLDLSGFSPSLVPAVTATGALFDPHAIRRDFPILNERVHGKRLVWLDNAATTQKPQVVIDRISEFYETENSNIHRAAHTLAGRATDAYENARKSVQRFLRAPSTNNIVFVRGATEGINLVAKSFGERHVQAGDEIVITWLEHHSNIVPWQQLAADKGARLRVAPVDDTGQVILSEYEKLLGPRTRLVALTQVSNALGTVTPVAEMTKLAHRHGAKVLVDGAQAVSHMPVDVTALDCDFYVFSGHKVFGPTGIGALYGKSDVLDAMPPWQGGGNMIADVTFEKTTYHPAPMRFEAGTGNIADAVGLGAALDYLEGIGLANVSRHEHDLIDYTTRLFHDVPGLRIIGTAAEKAGVVSFVLDGWRSEDVGAALDKEGVAVRSGHHCAQPALRRFGTETSVRPSFALYNTTEDIDVLVKALHGLQHGKPRES